MNRSITTAVACAAALLATGTAASIAADTADHRAVPPGHPPVQAATPQVDPRQSARFEVLQGGRASSDEMPAHVRAQLSGPSEYGKNVALSRAIDTPDGKGWVIPGTTGICIAMPDGTTGTYPIACNSTESAEAGEAISTLTRPNNPVVRVVGVLPSDATDPVVEFSDGTTKRVKPDEGVLSETLYDPKSLTFTTAAGKQTVNISPVYERQITIECEDGREVTVKTEAELPTAC